MVFEIYLPANSPNLPAENSIDFSDYNTAQFTINPITDEHVRMVKTLSDYPEYTYDKNMQERTQTGEYSWFAAKRELISWSYTNAY